MAEFFVTGFDTVDVDRRAGLTTNPVVEPEVVPEPDRADPPVSEQNAALPPFGTFDEFAELGLEVHVYSSSVAEDPAIR